MSQITKVRAALLVLSEPLAEEVPPREISRGLMQPAEPNPEFDKWAQDLFERLRALCIWKGIEPTASGGIDWRSLAVRLVFDYEPRNKHEPRIKVKRKRGAKPKHSTPTAEMARQQLLEIVRTKRASNYRLSVKKVAQDLAGKDNKVLPAFFKNMDWETLRKQIERAEEEAEWRQISQTTFSKLFGLSPVTRPNKKPG